METKQVTDFLTDLYQEPTKPGQKSTDSLAQGKMELLRATMSKLVNYGFLSDRGKIRDWSNALADKTEEELYEGLRKVRDHRGALSLGDFRNMCELPKLHTSHKPFAQLELKKSDPKTIEYWRNKRKAEIGI